jgi:hypothetical protein
VTTGADAGCWLWAEFREMAMPSSAKAKILIANRTKIMTLAAKVDIRRMPLMQNGEKRSVIGITFCR